MNESNQQDYTTPISTLNNKMDYELVGGKNLTNKFEDKKYNAKKKSKIPGNFKTKSQMINENDPEEQLKERRDHCT